jgi:hypothetical protein
MYESVLDPPSDDFVIPLRQSFMQLLGQDAQAAALLSVLEHWTNHERRENQLRRRENRRAVENGDDPPHSSINEALWVRRSRDKIIEDSLGLLPHEKAVTDAAGTLEDLGLIETGHPFRDELDNSKCYRLRIDRLNRELRSMSLSKQADDKAREQKIKIRNQQQEEDEEEEEEWSEEDWQYRYAVRWWERMEELGGRINSDWRNRKAQILQRWADAFDWCVRVRDLKREQIDEVLKWLFSGDCWWIESGNLVAPTKFKEKNDQDQWRIHEFMLKSQTKGGQSSDDLPSDGDEVSGFDKKRIVSKHSEISDDDFTAVRYADGGDEMIYRYDP